MFSPWPDALTGSLTLRLVCPAPQLKILGTVLEDHIAGITAGRYATDEKLLDVHLDLKKLVEEIASDWRGCAAVRSACIPRSAAVLNPVFSRRCVGLFCGSSASARSASQVSAGCIWSVRTFSSFVLQFSASGLAAYVYTAPDFNALNA